MDEIDKISEFIKAYKDKAVCIVGGFFTQVIHNKILFSILHNETAQKIFNAKQIDFIKKHIPFTTELKKDKYFDEALKNKDGWLIKPMDLYGSIGVAAGRDYEQSEWENILESSVKNDFVLQDYCTPYKSENCYVKNDVIHYGQYGNTTGLYLYAGKLHGLYSRQMQKSTTTTEDEGRVACSFLVE